MNTGCNYITYVQYMIVLVICPGLLTYTWITFLYKAKKVKKNVSNPPARSIFCQMITHRQTNSTKRHYDRKYIHIHTIILTFNMHNRSHKIQYKLMLRLI